MPASADIATYSTTGVFASTNSNVFSGPNGLTITYGNLPATNYVDVPPLTTASFGTFTVVGPTSGSDTVSDTFDLQITQTTPTSGAEALTDIFKGTVSLNGSSIKLVFTGGGPFVPVLGPDPNTGYPTWTFDLGNIQYWVNQTTPIVPSTNNGGVSTINAESGPQGVSTCALTQ
jgi:hypothetical protein